jgi:hypothetical protein
MKPFAQNHSARSASGGRDWIAVGKLVTEIRASRVECLLAKRSKEIMENGAEVLPEKRDTPMRVKHHA